MTKKDKLLKLFRNLPKDFTFEEAVSLFGIFNFVIDNKGSTSGSRVCFRNANLNLSYSMHKPHPQNVIKGYQMQQILDFLYTNNLMEKENYGESEI